MIATISSKGQLTIPKEIRNRLHLHTGDKVEFFLDEQGHLEIIPVTSSVKKLKGMVPPPKKALSLEEMDDAIRNRKGG
ncbi:MAG: AbrB/MazE/SpoVT family DNA-binding domain-containing protein [Sedimenticola sp.]